MHFDIFTSVDMTTASLEAIECCVPLSADALSDDEAEATADLFKALADPARVRIVNLLARSEGDPDGSQLIEPLGLFAADRLAPHEATARRGSVEREQRGKWAYFALRRGSVEKLALVADLKGVCC